MDLKPESFFEIELKAVFNREKYDQLNQLLNADPKYKLFNTESIKTDFYKANENRTDLRLRQSDKTIEIVCKNGLVTKNCRLEIRIPLNSLNELEHYRKIFDILPLEKQPRTLKHKQEFLYTFNGFDYVVCLQHIENFAHILEVEFLGQSESEAEIHVPNLLEILRELDLQLIDGEKFLKRVNDYVAGMNTINYE